MTHRFKSLHNSFSLASVNALIASWLAKGVNLALAEPFVKTSLDSIDRLWTEISDHAEDWHINLSRQLLHHARSPLVNHGMTTMSDFVRLSCGRDIRLETLGIYLTAAARASIELPFFHPLYVDLKQRDRFRRSVTQLADHILDLCLAFDHLDDLQLVFQYENWILHSYTDGDQSELYA